MPDRHGKGHRLCPQHCGGNLRQQNIRNRGASWPPAGWANSQGIRVLQQREAAGHVVAAALDAHVPDHRLPTAGDVGAHRDRLGGSARGADPQAPDLLAVLRGDQERHRLPRLQREATGPGCPLAGMHGSNVTWAKGCSYPCSDPKTSPARSRAPAGIETVTGSSRPRSPESWRAAAGAGRGPVPTPRAGRARARLGSAAARRAPLGEAPARVRAADPEAPGYRLLAAGRPSPESDHPGGRGLASARSPVTWVSVSQPAKSATAANAAAMRGRSLSSSDGIRGIHPQRSVSGDCNDGVDHHHGSARQRGHADRGARRQVAGKEARIDLIELREVPHLRRVDRQPQRPREIGPVLCADRGEVLHAPAHLRRRPLSTISPLSGSSAICPEQKSRSPWRTAGR